ncbi:hypothetical protein MUK42_37203, partial [Musa troglodytarum]
SKEAYWLLSPQVKKNAIKTEDFLSPPTPPTRPRFEEARLDGAVPVARLGFSRCRCGSSVSTASRARFPRQ